MKKKASTNYFFPTLLFIIFIFAGLNLVFAALRLLRCAV